MSGFPPSSKTSWPALRIVRDASDTLSYDALVEEAQHAELQGRRVQARELYEVALWRLREAPSAAQASDLLRWIARTHRVDGELGLALDCADAALVIAEAHGDVANMGHATNLLAIIHTQQGSLDQAERLYHSARELALRSGEAKLAAMTAQNLGVIANVRGDLDTALHYYETSLASYRALGLANDVCVALNNLGLLYTQRQQWSEAARAYDEAIGVAEVLGDQSTCVHIEVNRAESLVAQGDLAAAREACDRAMEISRRVKDPRALGELHKAYGIVARETGDFELAEQCLAEAEEIAHRRQDLLLLAESTKERAELHRRQGRNRDTLQCLNGAHRLFAQLRARRELADVGRRMARLESDFLDVARKWGESIECKDDYTQGHCERVADLACALAARSGMDEQSLFWFRIGALLHDVGKLVIPAEVLNKASNLSDDEWEIVRSHPSAGVEMLAEVDFPWDVRPLVESHHERWDGAGYPHGLKGEEIPLVARMLCIADVYDALTSERSYKRGMSHADAIEAMRLEVGKQFDPKLFPLFEEVAGELALSWRRPAPTVAPRRAAAIAASSASPLDELTDLPLRRSLIEAANAALATRREHEQVSLLVIDVDHFKLINDTYGHLRGDDVLRAVAQTLRGHQQPDAVLARFAGDEFALLLPDTTIEVAVDVAERLRGAVHAIPIAAGAAGPVALTISVGVAAAPPHGATFETLFASADAALYQAKRNGRDAVSCAGGARAGRPPVPQVERFTGRADERAAMVEHLQRAVRGEPQIVAVVGEAGVGKTALVRELSPDVRLRAGSLVVGRCVDTDTRPPYAPWITALDAIRVLRVVPERAWRELPRLLHALGDGRRPDQEGNRFALFEEVGEFLRLAAMSRPLVLLLDDMQWADEPSWDLLEYLAGRLDRERLLICITMRDEDLGGDVLGRRQRLSRAEHFHELRLGRLTEEELRQWVSRAFEQDVGSELLAFLYQQTEGNPFFTVQVLRALLEAESLHWSGERWEWRSATALRLPTAVKDLISRRLTRLSPKAWRTLSDAAVMGRSLDIDLAVAAGIGPEEDLLDAIEEGLAASVLETSSLRGDERVSFTHGLLVKALHEHVHPRRLRRIHGRIADALAARATASPAEIAVHYAAAGLSRRAYEYALRAADRAVALYAHDEAITFLELAERNAEAGAPLAEVHLRLAEVAEAAGRYALAEERCALALSWLAQQPDSRRAAECRRALVRIHGLRGLSPHAICAACATLLETAERDGLASERVALMAMISLARGRMGDLEGAESIARDAVEHAERTGDAALAAAARARLGSALVHTSPTSALEQYERAASVYAAIDDVYGLLRTEIDIGAAHALLGSLSSADAAFERALTRSRAVHSLEFAGLCTLNRGEIALRWGRNAQARLCLEEAHEAFRRVSHEYHRLCALVDLGHLAREQNQLLEAAERYDAVVTRARALGLVELEITSLSGAGLVALEQNKLAAARTLAAEASACLRGRSEWWFQGRELHEALVARLALRVGKVDDAKTRFQDALALAEPRDVFAAAWLAADFARALPSSERGARLRNLLQMYAARVDELGLALLAPRYAALLGGEPSARAPSGAADARRELSA